LLLQLENSFSRSPLGSSDNHFFGSSSFPTIFLSISLSFDVTLLSSTIHTDFFLDNPVMQDLDSFPLFPEFSLF